MGYNYSWRERADETQHDYESLLTRTESWYTEAVNASEEASKNVLFQYLYAIPRIRAHQAATDRKKIRAWLKALDNIAERFRKQPRGK